MKKLAVIVSFLLLGLMACAPTETSPPPTVAAVVTIDAVATPTLAVVPPTIAPTATAEVVALPTETAEPVVSPTAVDEVGNEDLPVLDATYSNPMYGFVLNYPSEGYDVNEFEPDSEKAASLFLFSVNEPAPPDFVGMFIGFNVVVDVLAPNPGETLEDVADRTPFSGVSTISERAHIPYRGVDIAIEQVEQGNGFIQEATYFENGGYVYVFHVLAMNPEQLAEYRPLARAIRETLYLTAPSASLEPVLGEAQVFPADNGSGWEAVLQTSLDNVSYFEDGSSQYYVKLDLINPATSAQKTVVDEWRFYGFGFTVPRIVGWGANSLFYTDEPVPDGSPFFVNGWDLHEFNYETGVFVTHIEHNAMSLALSPQMERVAYGNNGLAILDLASGVSTAVDLSMVEAEYRAIGQLVWSADGRMVYATVGFDWFTGDGRVGLVSVDTAVDNAVTVLIPPQADSFPYLMLANVPPQDGRLQLQDEAGVWFYDLGDGSLTQV